MSWPLDDRLVQNAVSNILERSERQEDLDQLQATFVDPGIAIRLSNNNNQIVFGRRGTGKTHVLKVIQHEGAEAANELPVYIDMRTLGSSALWEDAARPGFVRVANLLKDVLSEIQVALLDYATRPTTDPPGEVFQSLNDLSAAITRSVMEDEKLTAEEGASVQASKGAAVDFEASLSPKLKLRGEAEDTSSHTLRIVREGRPFERILFREIGEALQRVLADAGLIRLVLLLDEWSAIPAELQPLLAEFVKRTLFPYPRITVKIAAVEYRCCFGVPLTRNNTLGFELTADVSTSLELDEFFVYDKDERATLDIFGEVLYRHVAAECDRHWLSDSRFSRERVGLVSRDAVQQFAARRHGMPGFYLRDRFGIRGPQEFVNAFFEGDNAFIELARAGEGVARDVMSLFQDACFDTLTRRKVRIDGRTVRHVAREWFVKEKIKNVDDDQAIVLRQIVKEVVGHHKARSFLLDREAERSEMIRSLFDLRLIHLVKRGFIPEGDDEGRQYNVYTLDFGTYVDALSTEFAPSGDFSRELGTSGESVVVPFHDERAIKRVVLAPEFLTVASA